MDKKFQSDLNKWKGKGYRVCDADVSYNLKWYDKEEEKCYDIILKGAEILDDIVIREKKNRKQ